MNTDQSWKRRQEHYITLECDIKAYIRIQYADIIESQHQFPAAPQINELSDHLNPIQLQEWLNRNQGVLLNTIKDGVWDTVHNGPKLTLKVHQVFEGCPWWVFDNMREDPRWIHRNGIPTSRIKRLWMRIRNRTIKSINTFQALLRSAIIKS